MRSSHVRTADASSSTAPDTPADISSHAWRWDTRYVQIVTILLRRRPIHEPIRKDPAALRDL